MSAISGFSKATLLNRLCKTDEAEKAMDMFMDRKRNIVKAGCELFMLMFNGKPPKDLGDMRFDITHLISELLLGA